MRKEKLSKLGEFRFIIYTTICVFIFMMVIPLVSIKSDKDVDIDEYLKEEEVSDTISNEVSKNIVLGRNNVVNVYITATGKTESMNIEEYVCGVVANEMQASFDIEALKAQAIASRTYVVSKILNPCSSANGADICDSTHCQVYTAKETAIGKWGDETGEVYWNKIKQAVDDTEGLVLTYNGGVVMNPVYFSTSSGNTESAVDVGWGDVEYLQSVESSGEEIASKFTSQKEMTISEFVSTVNSKYPSSGIKSSNLSSMLNVISRSSAGGVISMAIGNETIKGSDFRFLIGLNSTNFTYTINDKTIVFDCKGYGHGVGMSQWGANVMAKEGKDYEEILKHYYTGIDIGDLTYN